MGPANAARHHDAADSNAQKRRLPQLTLVVKNASDTNSRNTHFPPRVHRWLEVLPDPYHVFGHMQEDKLRTVLGRPEY